jgi:hypothetical protein
VDDVPPQQVMVERRIEDDGRVGYYFLVSQRTPEPPSVPTVASVPPPTHIALLWDASLSRASADRMRELALIRNMCATWDGTVIDV